MHYYIDGYNLLFSSSSSGKKLEQLRREMVEELDEIAEILNITITIIFDAHATEGEFSITHYRLIEIIYSSYGETADDLIIKLLKGLGSPKRATLVTSDNKLAWKARHLLVNTVKVDSFIEEIRRRCCAKKALRGAQREAKLGDPTIHYYEKIFTERLKELEKGKK